MCLLLCKGSEDTAEFTVLNNIILLFTASFMPQEHSVRVFLLQSNEWKLLGASFVTIFAQDLF